MNNAEAGKVAILRAEWAVQDIHVLNQFRRQRLQSAEVTLTVTLCGLVLLNVIDQDFQTAVYSTVIEVEAKPPDLERLPSSFVLSRVDPGIQRFQQLIIT